MPARPSLALGCLVLLSFIPPSDTAPAPCTVLAEGFDHAQDLAQTVFDPGADRGSIGGAARISAGVDRKLVIAAAASRRIHLAAKLASPVQPGAWALGFELEIKVLGAKLLCCPDRTGSHGFNRLLGIGVDGRVHLLGTATEVRLEPGQRVRFVAVSHRSGQEIATLAFLTDPIAQTVLAAHRVVEPGCGGSWSSLALDVDGGERPGVMQFDDFLVLAL